jgi:predicted nucleotide-binding protein
VSEQLAAVEVGIICLTSENMDSKWLNFEAGALSKHQTNARVCIYAVDVSPADVTGPLEQFQIAKANREDTYHLVKSLNSSLKADALDENRLRDSFGVWWPVLETQLTAATTERVKSQDAHRTVEERLDEALEILRMLAKVSEEPQPAKGPPPNPASVRPSRERPRVFIGSSSEGLQLAEVIQLGLDHVAECTIWNQGVFGLSSTTIESIVDTAAGFDFAVLILTPDDITTKRGATANSPRDNLLFELGLFTGILGRARTFLVHPRDSKLHLPSDLAGVTAATYSERSDGNLEAAVGPVCTRIKRAMGVA